MKRAKWICNPNRPRRITGNPWGDRNYNNRSMILPDEGGIVWFKRAFTKSADDTVSIEASSLGIFDLFVNGERVGSFEDGALVYDELKPGWTDYNFRVASYTYDLTPFCQNGENVLTVALSDGWWSGRISFGNYGCKNTAFMAEITLQNSEREETIVTDTSWQTLFGGHIRTADIYDGEMVNATYPPVNQNPNAYAWESATLYTEADPLVEPLLGPPVREKKQLMRRPVSASHWKGTDEDGTRYGRIHQVNTQTGIGCEKVTLQPGETLTLDFGQNMVSMPCFTLQAAKGTCMTVLCGEMLNDSGDTKRGCDGPMGSVYIQNYRTAKSRLVYIASGEGIEQFTPAHSFFGFRYLEITADATLTLDAIEGRVVGSQMTETSSFSCSDSEVNTLYSNILWGMRSNYLSVATDCPQRDERLGWTGDAQIFSGAGSYLANINDFMTKWLRDGRDSQKRDGGFAEVFPRSLEDRPTNSGDAAWADAGVIIPAVLRRMYGTPITKEHYDAIEVYMDFLATLGEDGPRTTYGDWLAYDPTEPRFVAICYYACDAMLMEAYSRQLSQTAGDHYDSRTHYYQKLSAKIKAHFCDIYLGETGLTEQSQTACLLALKFKMLPDEWIEPTKTMLRKKIIENGYRLSTGFVGTGALMTTLSEYGMDDLCYSLLLQTAEPSWLCSVRAGATTVWERWNSYTKERGFGDVGMNSFNHYAYGAVAEWFFTGMAGIRPDEDAPGFERLILAPRPDLRKDEEIPVGQKRITWVSASYDSVKGKIVSEWHYENRKFVWCFTIPEGVTAAVEIPLPSGGGRFTVNGTEYKQCGKAAHLSLPAGKYLVREV